MTARLVALVVDAVDPPGLAGFWAEALGWAVDGTGTGLVPDAVTTFAIEFRPTTVPKAGRNRIHLDLTTTSLDDQQSSVERLLGLGATHLDVGQGPEDTHVVLADPEGNELCLIAPDNRFLAGRGRLGALSCDGSRAVGVFWSAALGWPLFWDQDEETAIRTPDGSGPYVTWGGGPEIPKVGRNRLRLEVAGAVVERLVGLGATVLEPGLLADPDGNEFSLRTD